MEGKVAGRPRGERRSGIKTAESLFRPAEAPLGVTPLPPSLPPMPPRGYDDAFARVTSVLEENNDAVVG